MSKNIIKQLQERDLIAQLTNKNILTKKLKQGLITLYCGFDPTSDSLHLGHLVPLLCLNRFQLAGHKPIILIGGATALIGDPSFKENERKLNSKENIQKCIEKIHKQILYFLNFNCGKNSALIINNDDWFHKMDILTFLRDIGKHFSINKMINKESVKQRLNRNDLGISFTEFTYNLLQSYDFAILNKNYNVELQIGGSDQWGNIVSGIDLTNRLNKKQVFGLTIPLITKSNGIKFGKTETGTIWLDPKKTSPYKFYQFWINTSDEDVYYFLKILTFMKLSEINSLKEECKKNNKKRCAQYILAEIITKFVHGDNGLITAKRITKNLFSNTILNLTESDFEQLAQDGMPSITLFKETDLQQALVDSELAASRNQARISISSNAISINGQKKTEPLYVFNNTDRLFKRFTLISRGKKNIYLIKWIMNI
ncbi:Tyrosine--tRNA ligase [Candidatus Providencia siddallii]|uniref:Tyrosine--tRNA ligase n=1 Tax=Candidatus Providencia siddallii TaxID=1715285 RepID=A0A0M6W7P7_9GAMM|nr:Tyrosine--tRNA ligase [Candidatus Providencia siddallii]